MIISKIHNYKKKKKKKKLKKKFNYIIKQKQNYKI